jgi:hypothetical protein
MFAGMSDIEPAPDLRLATLKRLAQELKMPVEAFLSDQFEGEVGDLLTFMRLWAAIEDSQGRRRVISVARQEAVRAGDKGER